MVNFPQKSLSLIFFIYTSSVLSFNCADIQEQQLCTDTIGCIYAVNSCTGQIKVPDHCNQTEKCLFVDPSYSGSPQDGTIDKPFANLTQAFEAPSLDVTQTVHIYGLKREKDNVFYMSRTTDVYNVFKSISLQPLQTNNKLRIEISTSLPFASNKFMKVHKISQNIKLDFFNIEFIVQAIINEDNIKSFGINGLFFLQITESKSSIRFENSRIIFSDQLNVYKTSISMGSSEVNIKLVDLEDEMRFVPIPYNAGLTEGNIDIINCTFNGGLVKDIGWISQISSFKMINVSFENTVFQDFSWLLHASIVVLENLQFKNISLQFDREINRQQRTAFLDFNSNVATLTNISLENSNLPSSQFLRVFSGQITIQQLTVSNISTTYPILEFTQTRATLSELDFKYLIFPQTRINSIEYIPNTPPLLPQLSIGRPPLCINATLKSTLTILNSQFTNITSSCIYRHDSFFSIQHSNFSNENMELFVASNQLDLTQNSVSWIVAEKDQAAFIQHSKIETNYLKPERGGALILEDFVFYSINNVTFKNLTASRGGVAYLRLLDIGAFYQSNFIDNQASLTGGVLHVEKSNNVIVQTNTIKNCYSNHRGSLIYASADKTAKVRAMHISILDITLSKYGVTEQFFHSQYNDTLFSQVTITANPFRHILSNDIIYKQIIDYQSMNNVQYDQINQYRGNVSLYLTQNLDNSTPRYLKITIFELDPIQYQIQNQSYFKDLSEIIKRGENHQLRVKSSDRILLEGENQSIPQSIQLSTKSGLTLKVLITFEFFDQYDHLITSTLQNDGLQIELVNQNTSSQKPFIQGQKFQYFSQDRIFLNPQNQYISSSIEEEEQQQYYLILQQILNDKTVLQDYPFKINFKIPIKFENCTIGEEYIQGTQTCRPCLKNLYSFDNPQEAVCQACQENSVCIGSNNILAEQGYWRYEKFSPITSKCPFPEDCIGGQQVIEKNQSIFNENGFCKFPSTGNLCNQCLKGFARASPQSPCKNCQQDTVGYLYFAFMLLFQISLILLIIITSIKFKFRKGQKIMNPNEIDSKISPEQRVLKEKSRKIAYQLSQIIKIVFNYTETLRIINQYSLEKLQLFLPNLISGLASSIPSQDSALFIQCFIELFESDKAKHYWIKYLAVLLKPFVLFLLISLIFYIYFVIRESKKRKRKFLSKSSEQVNSEEYSVWRSSFNNLKQYYITMITVILYFSQSHIIVATLDLFDCQALYPQGEPKYFLFYNSDIECWVGTHRSITFFVGIPILLLFGLFLPLFTFLKLRGAIKYNKNELTQSQSSKQTTQQKFSVSQWLRVILVKDSIKEENYFWEILITLRKSLLVIIFVILRRLDYLEAVIVALLVMIIFTFLHYQRMPYKIQKLNNIEFIGYCSICLLLMALIVLTGSKAKVKFSSYLLDAGFVVTSLIFTTLVLLKVISLIVIMIKQSKQMNKMRIKINYIHKESQNDEEPKSEDTEPNDKNIQQNQKNDSIQIREHDINLVIQTEQSLLDEESPRKEVNPITNSNRGGSQLTIPKLNIPESNKMDESKQEVEENQNVEEKNQNFVRLNSSPRKLKLAQEQSSMPSTPLSSQRGFFELGQNQNESPNVKSRKRTLILDMINGDQESSGLSQIEYDLSSGVVDGSSSSRSRGGNACEDKSNSIEDVNKEKYLQQ